MARRLASLVAMSLTTLFGLFLYGTYVMFSFGGDHPRVSNTQVAVVTGGVTVPYLASIAIDTSEPVGGASVGLFLAGGLLTVALRRYPVTTGFPKNDYVARTRVVETLQEAVVVLDWDAHVLDLNEAAVELFGRQASDVVGEPLRTVVDGIGDADLTVVRPGLPRSGRRRAADSSSSASPPSLVRGPRATRSPGRSCSGT
jgi:PAS domain-containing protein